MLSCSSVIDTRQLIWLFPTFEQYNWSKYLKVLSKEVDGGKEWNKFRTCLAETAEKNTEKKYKSER